MGDVENLPGGRLSNKYHAHIRIFLRKSYARIWYYVLSVLRWVISASEPFTRVIELMLNDSLRLAKKKKPAMLLSLSLMIETDY